MPNPKPYVIKIRGLSIEANSEEEVISLLRRLGYLPATGPEPRPRRKRPLPERSAAFVQGLRTLQHTKYLTSTEFAKALGLAGPRGLSPVLTFWARELKACGFRFDEVVVHHIDAARNRWYTPGPKIEAAIQHLSQEPE